MRFSFASATVVALAAQTVAGDWLGKSVYNKWHETELERWLSDHDIPYPTPYDRKNLEDLVKDNWEDNIASPYRKWDVNQLTNYITSSGKQVKKGTEKNVDSLIEQAQGYWHQTSKQATDTYGDVQSWIFNTWTESELKAFLDYHHIPNPTPRTRDSLLQTARSNYQTIATKIGESVNYPGDWLYQSWSDSELKAWLDERGIPVPQTGSREKLSASAKDTQQYLSDQILDSWTDSEIKAWCDRNGIKVPQGSKSNELKALARKHAASLSGNNVKSSASSAYGAATSSAGNFYPQITDEVYAQARYWYDLAANQLGFAGEEVKSSFSSVSSVASVEASKLSVAASKSASSASVAASKKGENAAAAAASAAAEATKSAKASASSASVRARASSASARARASATSLKNEL